MHGHILPVNAYIVDMRAIVIDQFRYIFRRLIKIVVRFGINRRQSHWRKCRRYLARHFTSRRYNHFLILFRQINIQIHIIRIFVEFVQLQLMLLTHRHRPRHRILSTILFSLLFALRNLCLQQMQNNRFNFFRRSVGKTSLKHIRHHMQRTKIITIIATEKNIQHCLNFQRLITANKKLLRFATKIRQPVAVEISRHAQHCIIILELEQQ
mmetsp:Transcript_23211/g.37172  ORF Transcript_23211/g.37172 Transcript_23211/m.37172 type:complete len:210 (-) Transcript_23211:1214-1843(-)